MRFSDAIRLGAMLHPQGFGNYFQTDPVVGGGVRTCAIGAAEAAGAKHARYVHVPLDAQCPGCLAKTGSLTQMIVHLNDDHHWTREAIADWVDTVEQPTFPLDDKTVGPFLRVTKKEEVACAAQ